jgi:ATP-dependent DNA ligase
VPAIRRQAASAWALELKHDGYRLQIHVKDGWVLLYTINPKAPAATRILEEVSDVSQHCAR